VAYFANKKFGPHPVIIDANPKKKILLCYQEGRPIHFKDKNSGDYKLLCRCHYSITQNYILPVDIAPSDQLKARIPADLPLQAGKVTCNTCHDIVAHCRDNPIDTIFLKENNLLRGALFANRTSFCFRCHDIYQYQRYNPHEKRVIPNKRAGATGAGEKKRRRLVDNMCIKCHPMRELIMPEDFVPPES